MLKRKAYEQLVFWKKMKAAQALLVTGARQIGKTYLIREFAKRNYENVVEINLIENAEACASFNAAKSSSDLFTRITVEAETELIEGRTVIFIDEVQEAKEVVTFIKFLVERKDYDYILSGSMLGVELKDIRSVPIGYLRTVEMYPLDFEEFCWAKGLNQSVIDQMAEHFDNKTPVEDFLHTHLLELFHQYLIIGGLPEPVSAFVNTDNIQTVRALQENIIKMYRHDITRYSAPEDVVVIKRIFDLIPSELNQQNKRFIIKRIDGQAKFGRNENRFLWLVDANVALATYNVQEPRHPLLLSMDGSSFKLFLADVGLLTSLCGMDTVREVLAYRVGVNYGALYENAVAQELIAHGHRLFYFKNSRLGEVDFIIENKDGEVLPLEIKSGKDYKRHRALNNVLNVASYGINQAYVFHEGNVQRGLNVWYLPIYMISCLDVEKRLHDQWSPEFLACLGSLRNNKLERSDQGDWDDDAPRAKFSF